MDEQVRIVLDELHTYGLAHDAGKEDRLERLRNLEPDTAALLALIVRATGARRVLEIGTSNGYSTLWLADAVRATGGHIVSIELDPDRSAQAARNLARGGVTKFAEVLVQDARDTLRQSADDAWDLVFLDAERPAYVSYWPDLVRALRPGGLLAVDNVTSHADDVADFRALVEADESMTEAVAPTGAGLLLAVRDRQTNGSNGV
jgi:predicted O-methyltransferase YrrM